MTQAAARSQLPPDFDEIFRQWEQGGFGNLVAALRWVVAGERDEADLMQGLNLQASAFLSVVLAVLQDPEILKGLSAAP